MGGEAGRTENPNNRLWSFESCDLLTYTNSVIIKHVPYVLAYCLTYKGESAVKIMENYV